MYKGAKLAKSTEELRRLEGVRAISYDVKGNYGVAISWSDGHYADIYSFDTLRRIAEEEAKDKSSIVF